VNLSGLQNVTARGAAGLFLLAGLLLLAPASSFAHAKLLRSLPKSNETAPAAPKRVELWFSTEVSPGFSTIEVTDSGGVRVDRGEVSHAEGGKKAQVELGELGAGAYTVVWKVVSVDEHTIRGKFTFKVTAAAAATPSPPPTGATQATPAGPAAGVRPDEPEAPGAKDDRRTETAAAAGESTITWLDNLVRWLAYLAMMTLFGGFATRLFVLGPAFEGDGNGDATTAAARRTVSLLRAGVALLLPTLFVALALQSSSVNGVGLAEAVSPALLGVVVTKTGYGTAWLVTALGAAAVAVIAFLVGRPSEGPTAGGKGLWWAGLLASGVMFVGPSLTGHAMAAAGQHHFAVVSDWLHLAAGGFWVGGLFHLALAAPAALSRLGGAERGPAVGRVIKRFTKVAVPSVGVVSLAGLYSSWIHLGSVGALWGTPYGRTLLVKLLLVVAMLLLGAINGFRYGPRAGRLAGADDEGARGAVERGFLRSVRFEAALGVLVLLAAAVLVFVTPGRNDAMEAGPGARAERQQGGK
jgi:copper transport protein